MVRQEITRTPRVVSNPEAQECTHEDIYNAAQAEIAEHTSASHGNFLRLREMQEGETHSSRDELEERYWARRYEAERIYGEKVQADWQTSRDRSK